MGKFRTGRSKHGTIYGKKRTKIMNCNLGWAVKNGTEKIALKSFVTEL